MTPEKPVVDRDAPVLVLSTCPAEGDLGTRLAAVLVEERLAACVNILPPMTSVYRWDGQVEQAAEHQLIIKTTADHVDAVRVRLAALHPYELPELMVLPVTDGGAAYLEWVRASVRP